MNISNHYVNDDQQSTYVRQHLIDPALCLACGSCQSVCPEKAIEMDFATHRYAVNPELCSNEHDCLAVCSSDAIKAWRMVPADQMYSLDDQFAWEDLPAEIEIDGQPLDADLDEDESPAGTPAPASASVPVSYLYSQKNPVIARISSNTRVTEGETDIHHIVLDFDDRDFPWLEGQNIGVIPDGLDANGRAHQMRAYSIASERNGETSGTREVALTVKRVIDEWGGQPYYGIASNFICDLEPGADVRCVGPIGERFLMPQDPGSRILMICTGTGIAPMRSFIQRQQRLGTPAQPMELFYGGRTPAEMAYYDELLALPTSLLNCHTALSRSGDQPRRYVQDLIVECADIVAGLLGDDRTHIFLCGLVTMEQGIMEALSTVATGHGVDWQALHKRMLHEGRLQIETY